MKKRIRHGLSGTHEHKIWKGIKKRCFNPDCDNYGAYGGRGITMCNALRKSVRHFLSTVGKRPEGTEIDRKDNDGHYSCGNCRECKEQGWPMNLRWVTHKENCLNTRKSRLITFRGKTQTIGAWEEETGISHMVIHRRLEGGWSLKRALTTPADMIANQPKTLPKRFFRTVEILYKRGKSLPEISKRIGFKSDAIRKCLVKQGIPLRSLLEQRKLQVPVNSTFIEFRGHTKTLKEWAAEADITVNTLTMRLRRGWSVEKSLTTPLRQW